MPPTHPLSVWGFILSTVSVWHTSSLVSICHYCYCCYRKVFSQRAFHTSYGNYVRTSGFYLYHTRGSTIPIPTFPDCTVQLFHCQCLSLTEQQRSASSSITKWAKQKFQPHSLTSHLPLLPSSICPNLLSVSLFLSFCLLTLGHISQTPSLLVGLPCWTELKKTYQERDANEEDFKTTSSFLALVCNLKN